MFGPFGLLMLICDFILWCCQFCCCKRKRPLYTPRLGEEVARGNVEALETESQNGVEINLI